MPASDDKATVAMAAAVDVLSALLEMGVDPDARVEFENGDATWGMPLYGCVRKRNLEMAKMLIAHGGDAEILRLAMGRVSIPEGDPRWHGLLRAPLEFWNHWYGPWCHLEWDRGSYLACFRLILEKSGPPVLVYPDGLTILEAIAQMGDHVTDEERAAFAAAVREKQSSNLG